MRRPHVQFTVRRMMVVVVVIALVLASMTWFIRLINDINRSLGDFYGPEGTQKRIREYQGEVNPQAKSK